MCITTGRYFSTMFSITQVAKCTGLPSPKALSFGFCQRQDTGFDGSVISSCKGKSFASVNHSLLIRAITPYDIWLPLDKVRATPTLCNVPDITCVPLQLVFLKQGCTIQTRPQSLMLMERAFFPVYMEQRTGQIHPWNDSFYLWYLQSNNCSIQVLTSEQLCQV